MVGRMNDTDPKDQDALRHDASTTPSRQAQPGEILCEFLRDRVRVELRDHGPHGTEAQFLLNDAFLYSRRFTAVPSLKPATASERLE